VTTPGGHCHFWGGEADGPEQVREVIGRQLAHGVDWIKVMATGGVFTKGTSPRAAQFDATELGVVVAAAREAGRSVAAHCHGTDGIRNAALAGVRTIEHCSFAGDTGFGTGLEVDVVDAVARAGAWVSPTVNAGWGRRIEQAGRPSRFFLRMARVLGALERGGVPLIASTDAGIPGVLHHHLPLALPGFARYAGLSPVRTLRAATSESARALGIDDETGSIRPGLAADLLVVDGHPLEDLTVLQNAGLVVARGRVVPG
jgi:imidazolonepropionase-like amidohydrolase